ncbi:winged helix-turn-helix transcriptional regulator [Streptomyces decoyicus]|uniref:winged helix-turn-helix transcriptional regulator n=1 Tax=Streptomyces decoyicus TaxID=249567 RepID=UPI00362BE94C
MGVGTNCRQLRERTLRFGELHRAVRGISQRMLTLNLRQLERDGFLTRTVHPSVPSRVDYALAPLGSTLLTPWWPSANGPPHTDRRSTTIADATTLRRYDATTPPAHREPSPDRRPKPSTASDNHPLRT